MTQKITLELDVDDKGSVKVSRFADNVKDAMGKAETSVKGMGGPLTDLKNNWAMMSAGIASAMYVAEKAYGQLMKAVELGEFGAKIERTEAAFYSVAKAAGISADETVRALKMAAQGMMDESDIMVKASRLIQVGIPISTLTELMNLLVKQAPIVGDTLPEAWDKFGEALAKGKLKGVQNYIGLVDLEAEMVKYATSIGRTVEELTDESKMMITAEIVTAKLRETTKGLGESQETASEKILKAKVQMNEAHELMAKSWIPIATGYYQAMAKILEVWNSLSNRPEPDWVKKQKGTLGAGASGSWGSDPSKFTMDNATATMTPLQLTFQKDEKAAKAQAEKLKNILEKQAEDFIKSWGIMVDAEQDALDEAAKMEAQRTIDSEKEFQKQKESFIMIWGEMVDAEQAVLIEMIQAERAKVIESEKLYQDQKEQFIINSGIAYDAEMEMINEAARAEAEGAKKRNKSWEDGYKDRILMGDDFWAGVKLSYDESLKDQLTWGRAGADIWMNMFGRGGIIEGTLSTFFEDAFTGKLKTASDYFKAFADSILKMFADMIAKMIAQWAAAKIGDLVLGTGGGTATGGITGGNSVTNSLVNTGLSAGLNAGIDYLAGTTGGLSGLGSSLWSMAGWGGPGSGLSSAAAGTAGGTGTGTAVGGGALAGLGAAAAIYAAVYAYIQYGKANFGGTGYAMNPFLESNIPLMINPMGGTPGVNEAEVMAMIAKPDLDIIKKRFKETFGIDAPTEIASNDPLIGPITDWIFAQPEILAAQKAYAKYIAGHYKGVQSDTGFSYVPIDRHARGGFSSEGPVSYAAGGAFIDEPMVAFGRSGKRIVMGEAGPEYVGPVGKSGNSLVINIQGNVVGNDDFIEDIYTKFKQLEAWGH
jgi:hypothetical protein